MVNRKLVVPSLVVGVVLGLAGCGEGTNPSAANGIGTGPSSSPGGDRLPVQQPDEAYGHQSLLLTGRFALQDDGCWTLDLGDGPRLVVFPAGYFRPLDDPAIMMDPYGTAVEGDLAADVIGGIVPTARFPGVPDGYWDNYLDFCDPGAQEIVVLDALEPAFRPDTLSDDDLVALLRDADLSQSWGCGVGFAVSTADQRVALVIHLQNTSYDVDVPVSFPDAGWSAEILVGKLLMTQWCDDVIEPWEPQTMVAARWPLSGGELDFTPPTQTDCRAGNPVPASLTGIRVQTSTGEVTLEDLALVNDAYGCFAG